MIGQTLFNIGKFYERKNGDEYKNSDEHKKNYDLMKKYYHYAINLGNSNAMVNLGNYYWYSKHNIKLMKYYYNKAIKLNNSYAMVEYGLYYKFEQKYELMKHYYLMAIKLNNNDAMYLLGQYYDNKEHNYELAIKYYKMALYNSHDCALGDLISIIDRDDVIEYVKLYLEIFDSKNEKAIYDLNSYSDDYYQNIGEHYNIMKEYYIISKYYEFDIQYYHVDNKFKYVFIKLLQYYVSIQNNKLIYHLIYDINTNNKFNISYDYDTYYLSYNYEEQFIEIYYDLQPFIEYRKTTLNKINKFIFKHSRNYLYNPINGRLFIKNIVNKYT